MAIAFSHNSTEDRVCRLENEIDRMKGRKPRNKYTCTVCFGQRLIDMAYHGSPDYEPCSACQKGKLIDEANAKLEAGDW